MPEKNPHAKTIINTANIDQSIISQETSTLLPLVRENIAIIKKDRKGIELIPLKTLSFAFSRLLAEK